MLIGIQTGIQSPAALRQPMMPGFPVPNNRGPSSTYPYHQVKSCPLHLCLFQIYIESIVLQPPPYNRNVFVKPNESKQIYNGRVYPGQQIKHDVSNFYIFLILIIFIKTNTKQLFSI